MTHPFESLLRPLAVDGRTYQFYSLPALAEAQGLDLARLPLSVKILLESVVRNQGHPAYRPEQALALARWTHGADSADEFPFLPARVLFQDFTGVPCVVDLAAMRSALRRLGGDPGRIEPRIPVDLVIDHSVQLDVAGREGSLEANILREFQRNAERYVFLRWGQNAFARLRVLPPGLGICHQVNMEYLAEGVRVETDAAGRDIAFPDTLVGTDSHTVMINSMGIAGWGVGGIEAEAAMLGQPMPLKMPQVVGVRLTGRLQGAATPTDVALAVTELLRKKGVVEKFVEFFGPGLDNLALADRAPIANMAPEYGATTGLFPVDAATIAYLRETGRPDAHVALVEAYCRAQGLWREPGQPEPAYGDVVELDLSRIRPSLAGPRRPHERVELTDVGRQFDDLLTAPADRKGFAADAANDPVALADGSTLDHGAVVIASITSCTNTSNPSLLLAAGLLARKAAARGLRVPGHVKTSFAPGSRVAAHYLEKTGLRADLDRLGFQIAAYGCATCIGNSGPLAPDVEKAVRDRKLVVASVLSGNRNFEGRIHPLTRANYLASPPLVVAYALAGTVRIDWDRQPLGRDAEGRPVFLYEIWPSSEEVDNLLSAAQDPALYRLEYGTLSAPPQWEKLPAAAEPVFAWDPASTYIREPPYFDDLPATPAPRGDIAGAYALGFFGDFITTDHISPAGSIPKDSPAAAYLAANGVARADFNSYGARRGNHEVMMRGTFGNIRIRNRLVPAEGGRTVYHPTGEELWIYDAAMKYREAGLPLVVLAGKMYGAGSSRDWAAKGAALLGVRAVIAESFERIHRSNLVGMGVLPLEFPAGETADTLGLTGRERFTVRGLGALAPRAAVEVEAAGPDGVKTFPARVRIDTPAELDYYRHGGILPYVLRGALKA